MENFDLTSVRRHLCHMIHAAEARQDGQADAFVLKVCRNCLDDCANLTLAEKRRREANLEVDLALKRLFDTPPISEVSA